MTISKMNYFNIDSLWIPLMIAAKVCGVLSSKVLYNILDYSSSLLDDENKKVESFKNILRLENIHFDEIIRETMQEEKPIGDDPIQLFDA